MLHGLTFLNYYNKPEMMAEAWLRNEDMKKWKTLQQQPTNIIMGDGSRVADAMAKHQKNMERQHQEREQLRQEFLNNRGGTPEMQLGIIPVNY